MIYNYKNSIENNKRNNFSDCGIFHMSKKNQESLLIKINFISR